MDILPLRRSPRHREDGYYPGMIIKHARWRDAALHQAIPYTDYMRRADPLRHVS